MRSRFTLCFVPWLLGCMAPTAALSLTLEEKPDRWVVQRVHRGAWVGDLELAGTVPGGSAAVEARVLDEAGATVVGWTVVDAGPSGGQWSGTLEDVPQGGWYRVEARHGETVVTAANRLGVGLVVAAIGQSNMVKMFTEDEADGSLPAPFAVPDPLTRRYGYGEPAGYEYARPRTVDIPISWGEVTGTGGIRLANSLVAHLEVPVLVLDFSLDWTGLRAHWNNDLHRSWRRFSEALDLVGGVGVVLWHQGAYDANEEQPTAASYRAGLDQLYQRITDRLGGGFGSLPMVVAIQNRGDYDLDLAKDATYNAVRQAQLEWIAANAHGFAGGATLDLDISSRPGTGNGHFWASGYQEMADRLARGVLHAFGHPGFGQGVDGGHLVSATVRGTRVVVKASHDHGGRLRLPVPEAAIEGFALTDGEWLVDEGSGLQRNHLEIVSARLSDDEAGNWVELELAAPPAGPLRLRYLDGQNPFYAGTTKEQRRRNGNTLFDDFAYHPDRAGLPIHGLVQDLDVTPSTAVSAPASLAVAEGTSAMVWVRLLDPPGGPVTVNAQLVGDGDLQILSGPLHFDDASYSSQQPVEVAASPDADTDDGTALLRLTAAGHQGALVQLSEADADPHFELSAESLTVAGSGGTASFTVSLGTQPAGAVQVDVTSDVADLAVTPANLLFSAADWQSPQTVTVETLSGASGPANVTVSVNEAASHDGYDSAADRHVSLQRVGLGDGLLLHWPLDEAAGPSTSDLSGQGNGGVVGADVVLGGQGVIGGAMTSAGPGGGAGSLDDGVQGAGLAGLPLSEVSVSLWYRAPAGAGYLFTWGGSFNRANTISLYVDAGSEIRARVHDAADATSTLSVPLSGAADAWHHLALVKDASGSRLYLDGQLRLTDSAGDGVITPPRGITLGTNEFGTYGLTASFDDLRLYDRALAAGEVLGLSQLGRGTLRVDLDPPAAVAAGAGWRIEPGGGLLASGEVASLPPGEHSIRFAAPAGWLAPADLPVTVTLGDQTVASAVFPPQGTGTVTVSLLPGAAAQEGARWKLAGELAWRSSGETATVAAGDYTVTFLTPESYRPPVDLPITVSEGSSTQRTVYFIEEATADPIVLLPLDELSGGVAVDVSGNGHDAALGVDVITGVDGVFATAMGTQGAGGATGAYDSGLRVANLAGTFDRVTVSFWYRLPASAHDGYLLTWGGSYNDPAQISVYLDVDQGLRVRSRSGADTSSLELVSPPGYADTSWHHLAVSTGAEGTVTYFDGQEVNRSAMGAGTFTPPVGLRLGANENGQWGAEASFDDLRVWRRELPGPEVADLHIAGARGSLRVTLLPQEAVDAGARWRLASGSDTAWRTSGTTLTDVPAGVHTLEFEALPGYESPPAVQLTLGPGDDLLRHGVYSEVGGPILHWSLDETGSALDMSGNGRHGTYGADVEVGLVGLSGQAVATAGTGTSGGSPSDVVTTPDFAPDDSYLEATVALWYRLDVQHDGYLFSWGGSFNDANHLSAYLDPALGLRVRVHDAADTSSVLSIAPAGFADGGWHQLVVATDGAGSRVYFDGQPSGSHAMGQGVVTPHDGFTLGANERGTFGLEASFDEVRVWDRALSDAEVAALFAQQAKVPLTVHLSPAEAISAGARWRLGIGGQPRADGETIAALPGPRIVTFESLEDWREPVDVAVDLQLGTPVDLSGIYRSLEDGQLRVDLEPAAAVTAGARWRLLDGPDGAWRLSGETVTVPTGSYQLELGPAIGYLTPGIRIVQVTSAESAAVETVTYQVGGQPILHWPLDHSSAGSGLDVSGFARDARVGSRVAEGIGGVIGEAVQTAGPGGANGDTDDGLETGDFDTDDVYSAATVALWYRLPAQPHDGYLFSWGGSNNAIDHVSAFLDAGVELRVRVHDGLDATSVLRLSPPSFDDATWHHLAVVKDASGSKVYFDGALAHEDATVGTGLITPRDGFFLGMSEKREFGLEASFDDVRVWDRALSELEISNLVAQTPPPVGFGGAYRTVDGLHADLLRAAADFPSLVEIVDYGDSWAKTQGGHTTPGGDFVAGDELLAARVTNRDLPGDKPFFVLMACLHAREIATPELAMRFLDWLTEGYGSDPEATWLVDHHEIWILPMTNPDGHRHVELGAQPENGGRPWRWRKTVRAGGSCGWPPLDGSSTEGVDLNRNFPFQWGTSNGQAGSSDLCSENYRGPSPASEPETTGIMSLVSSLIPDQRGTGPEVAAPADTSGLFIQLHSPFRTVSWPWAYTAAAPPNADGLQAIGGKLAAIAGYTAGQTHDTIYRMTGTADDWVYGELGAPALLIEVGEGLMPPYHKIDNVLWPETRDAFIYAAKIARTPYMTARGPEVMGLTVSTASGGVDLAATANDQDNGGQAVTAAEAYLGLPPWDPSAVALPLGAVDGAFDTATENLGGFVSTAGLTAGRHLIWVRAQDAAGHWGAASAIFIDVP